MSRARSSRLRPPIFAANPSRGTAARTAWRSSAERNPTRSHAAALACVVEQTRAKRGQGDNIFARPDIGAAHLHIALEPNFREKGRKMVGPVGNRGAFARQLGQSSFQQVAERSPGHIVIDVAALDEIERHIERIIDVASNPMPGSKTKGSMPVRSRSVSVQICERIDRKPLGLPSVKGELANSAVIIGCRPEPAAFSRPCRLPRRNRYWSARWRCETSCRGRARRPWACSAP